jgi:hypothetical protein
LFAEGLGQLVAPGDREFLEAVMARRVRSVFDGDAVIWAGQ